MSGRLCCCWPLSKGSKSPQAPRNMCAHKSTLWSVGLHQVSLSLAAVNLTRCRYRNCNSEVHKSYLISNVQDTSCFLNQSIYFAEISVGHASHRKERSDFLGCRSLFSCQRTQWDWYLRFLSVWAAAKSLIFPPKHKEFNQNVYLSDLQPAWQPVETDISSWKGLKKKKKKRKNKFKKVPALVCELVSALRREKGIMCPWQRERFLREALLWLFLGCVKIKKMHLRPTSLCYLP